MDQLEMKSESATAATPMLSTMWRLLSVAVAELFLFFLLFGIDSVRSTGGGLWAEKLEMLVYVAPVFVASHYIGWLVARRQSSSAWESRLVWCVLFAGICISSLYAWRIIFLPN